MLETTDPRHTGNVREAQPYPHGGGGVHMKNTPDVNGEDLFISPSADMYMLKCYPQITDYKEMAGVWLEDPLLLPCGPGRYR